MTTSVGMSHHHYVAAQIERDPAFAPAYEEARVEAQLALALADLRERRGMSQSSHRPI